MSMPTQTIQQFSETLRGVEVVMVTATTASGHLITRPLVLQEVGADGTMWFFIGRSSALADNLRENPQVAVSHADAIDLQYVTFSGKATMVDDRSRISSLWHAHYLQWFPLGISDPELALIRVDVVDAEQWLDGAHLHLAVQR